MAISESWDSGAAAVLRLRKWTLQLGLCCWSSSLLGLLLCLVKPGWSPQYQTVLPVSIQHRPTGVPLALCLAPGMAPQPMQGSSKQRRMARATVQDQSTLSGHSPALRKGMEKKHWNTTINICCCILGWNQAPWLQIWGEREIPLAAIWASIQGWNTRAVLGAEMHILLFKQNSTGYSY